MYLQTPYIKATETVTTLLSAAAMERENGNIANDHSNNTINYNDKQEATVSILPCYHGN